MALGMRTLSQMDLSARMQRKDDELNDFGEQKKETTPARPTVPEQPPVEEPAREEKVIGEAKSSSVPQPPAPKEPSDPPAAPKEQKKVEKPKGTGRKPKASKGLTLPAISKSTRDPDDTAKLSVHISTSLEVQMRMARGYTKVSFSDLAEEALSGFLNNTYHCADCDLRFTIQGDAAPSRCPICGGEKLDFEHFLP